MERTILHIYWDLIEIKAEELGSDGCTLVSEWRRRCCLEHDIHYKTKLRWGLQIIDWVGDQPIYELAPVGAISRAQADARFRDCIRVQGGFWNDTRGWARWLGVRAGGWWAWHDVGGKLKSLWPF